jgi:hypothetical protein
MHSAASGAVSKDLHLLGAAAFNMLRPCLYGPPHSKPRAQQHSRMGGSLLAGHTQRTKAICGVASHNHVTHDRSIAPAVSTLLCQLFVPTITLSRYFNSSHTFKSLLLPPARHAKQTSRPITALTQLNTHHLELATGHSCHPNATRVPQ